MMEKLEKNALLKFAEDTSKPPLALDAGPYLTIWRSGSSSERRPSTATTTVTTFDCKPLSFSNVTNVNYVPFYGPM